MFFSFIRKKYKKTCKKLFWLRLGHKPVMILDINIIIPQSDRKVLILYLAIKFHLFYKLMKLFLQNNLT